MNNINDFLAFTIVSNEENNRNIFSIESREGIGRTIVATESVDELGKILLCEKPLMTWTVDNWFEYIENFLESSNEIKKLIHDMYIPPDNGIVMYNAKTCTMALEYSYSRFAELGRQRTTKLIAIGMANAHDYIQPRMYSTRGENCEFNGGISALFAFGSLLSHACLPNIVMTSSRVDKGCIDYIVVRPIKAGDMVCISYLDIKDNLDYRLCDERRKKIMNKKEFYCQCTQCNGTEYGMLRDCGSINCNEYVPNIRRSHHDNNKKYICSQCGVLDDKKYNSKMVKAINVWGNFPFLKEKSRQGIERTLKEQQRISEKAITLFKQAASPKHYLVCKAALELSDVFGKQAGWINSLIDTGMTKLESSSIFGESCYQLLIKGCHSSYEYISCFECISACCKLKICPNGHPNNVCQIHDPVYHTTSEVAIMFTRLQVVPKSIWPTYAIPLFRRYLPLLKVFHSREDVAGDDIQKDIEEVVTTTSSSESIPIAEVHEDIPQQILAKVDNNKSNISRRSNKKNRNNKK